MSQRVGRRRTRHLGAALALFAGGGCGLFKSHHVDKADTHYEAGDFCQAAQHYNEALRKEGPDPIVIAKRDQSARHCANDVLERAKTSVRQRKPDRALEAIDGFYTQTDGGQGVQNELLQNIRHEYEDAQSQFLAFPKESDARTKMVHYLSPRLHSKVIKNWFEPYAQEAADWHASVARKAEAKEPARAVLHYRLTELLGGNATVTKRLWTKASQRLIPPINWKKFEHCWKDAKAITEGLSGGTGTEAQGVLDLNVCETVDETFKEEIETSNRPDVQYANKSVPKEAVVLIRPNGMVEFDPIVFSDCVGQDADGAVAATCWISPTFKFRRKEQPFMKFSDPGSHKVPWNDQVLAPVAAPGESLVKKRVDRLRAGYQLAGTLKVQFGEVSETRTLHVELVEIGRPNEVAHGEAMHTEAIGRTTERLREILSSLVPDTLLPKGRAAENEGKLDEAEEDYLTYSLTSGDLKPETIDFVMRRYGLTKEEVSALFKFEPQ